MSNGSKYMRRCLDLALLGAGTVSPNPMVGAVIVVDDIIVGEGYTSPYGGPHAEVNAIQHVLKSYGEEQGRNLLKRSTVYVSLEPCAHFGKTPPCANMLVDFQVSRVVVGCLDPFAKVNGKGMSILQEAGVAVEVGLLEKECQQLNVRFFTRVNHFRPYVILKWAETQDGYFAEEGNKQTWISNSASKQLVHKWRSEEDAILVGKNTAIIDKPQLNNRMWTGKSPIRVLIDKNLEVPLTNELFINQSTDLIVFNAVRTDWKDGVKYIDLEQFDLYTIQKILYQLYLMDVQSLIVEGGAKTLNSFIAAGLWDEARVFVGENVWGKGIKAPKLNNQPIHQEKIATDQLLVYQNN